MPDSLLPVVPRPPLLDELDVLRGLLKGYTGAFPAPLADLLKERQWVMIKIDRTEAQEWAAPGTHYVIGPASPTPEYRFPDGVLWTMRFAVVEERS